MAYAGLRRGMGHSSFSLNLARIDEVREGAEHLDGAPDFVPRIPIPFLGCCKLAHKMGNAAIDILEFRRTAL